MKTVNLTITTLVLLLGLTACMQSKMVSKSSSVEVEENTPIVFTASFDDGWEGISSVGVMIDGTVKEYSVMATDNTSATLSSDDPYYWTDSNNITVTAWWPYTEGEIAPPNVVVNANQSTLDDFEGSNFISAEGQAVTYSSPTLTFTHRTARVTVNVTDSDGLQSVKFTGLSTANGNPSEITTYNASDGTYVALVAPQTVAQGTVFINCEFNDGDLSFEQSAAVWEAGQEYTYTVSRVVEGSGYTYDSVTNTYTVYTANGLLAWNEAAQIDPTLNCTLGADISLSGTWTPVGNYSNPYTGTFEGVSHTITGLTVSQSGENYVGLIGYLGTDGKVQNLTLSNMRVTGSSYVGGVVGRNGGGTVTSCTVSGTVSGTSTSVGGVVGYNSGTVTDCTSSGIVSSSASNAGGVVGNNYSGTVTSCTSSATVSGSTSVGGVVGYNYPGGTVTDCSSSGVVSGVSGVGGVVGQNNSAGYTTSCTVIACSSSGTVSGSFNIGGVVGENSYYGYVIACYHISGSVSGTSTSVGGVLGYNRGTVTACYSASGSVSGAGWYGGVVGYNYSGTVTACYWSNHDGKGVGYDVSSNSNTTKVDVTTVTWSAAVTSMNSAISTSGWKYVLTGSLPTLTKNE